VPVYVQEKGYRLDPRMRISILSTSKIIPRLNSVKTGPEATPVFCPIDIRDSVPVGKGGGGVKLTIHFHTVPKPRTHEALCPVSHVVMVSLLIKFMEKRSETPRERY